MIPHHARISTWCGRSSTRGSVRCLFLLMDRVFSIDHHEYLFAGLCGSSGAAARFVGVAIHSCFGCAGRSEQGRYESQWAGEGRVVALAMSCRVRGRSAILTVTYFVLVSRSCAFLTIGA